MGVIETEVDKLLELLNEKKKISIHEAAKKLGVDNKTIEEWADFLEEEGVIKVEYTLTTPILVLKEINEQDIKNKEKELSLKKSVLLGKAQKLVKDVDKNEEYFKELKRELDEIKKYLGKDAEKIEKELKEIEEYNNLKKKSEEIIENQKREYEKKIEELQDYILREQKKYLNMLEDLKKEELKIEVERTKIKELEEKENELKNKLDEIQKYIEETRSKLVVERKEFSEDEKYLNELKKSAEQVRNKLENEKRIFSELVEKSKKEGLEIIKKQEEKINLLAEKIKNLDLKAGTQIKISERLKKFFERKEEIEKLLKDLIQEHDLLKNETREFLKRLKLLNSISKKPKEEEIKEMEDNYDKLESKRVKIEELYKKISSLLKDTKGTEQKNKEEKNKKKVRK
ncbi:MAG: hypothetical protein QXU20_01955 [Candidatus Woesearchaeota archaeon]